MRNRPEQQPLEIGEQEKTPFVRFDAGIVYPPNNIYESAQNVLEGLKSRSVQELFNSLIKKGVVHGQYRVLLDSTWYAVLSNFLHYHVRGASNQCKSIDSCVGALQIMVKRPCEDAWLELRGYLIEGIDELSGWNSSFDRRIAEERLVFQGEDGNYYYHDSDGQPIQIIGAETTQETRLDFVLSQLLARTGFLRQFLGLFSLFAIADDFERNRAHYHGMIKAVLPESERGPIECDWTFMHFDHSRSYLWRPQSNLCDPGWLAGDIFGKLTDTLDRDFWHRNVNLSTLDHAWLDDGLRFQMDYVLDTTLKIGTDPYAYVTFEGKVMRWINGTPEAEATISIGVANLNDHKTEDDQLNRFLSLLVWQYGGHARIKEGVGGARTAHSKVYSPRMSRGLRVDPGYLQRGTKLALTTDQKLALGLYREAQNSSSTFYEFLSYYKILELAVPNKGNTSRSEWLNTVAIPKLTQMDRLSREVLNDILAKHSDLEHYLREIKVNGIKHSIKKTVDTDNPLHQISTAKDNYLMEEIAKLAMRDQLGL
jgi:hypothetical protein